MGVFSCGQIYTLPKIGEGFHHPQIGLEFGMFCIGHYQSFQGKPNFRTNPNDSQNVLVLPVYGRVCGLSQTAQSFLKTSEILGC